MWLDGISSRLLDVLPVQAAHQKCSVKSNVGSNHRWQSMRSQAKPTSRFLSPKTKIVSAAFPRSIAFSSQVQRSADAYVTLPTASSHANSGKASVKRSVGGGSNCQSVVYRNSYTTEHFPQQQPVSVSHSESNLTTKRRCREAVRTVEMWNERGL